MPEHTETASEVDALPDTGQTPGDVVDDSLSGCDPSRYEDLGEHARGGLGRVVRAHDRKLGRTIAIKELLRESAGREARFLREAKLTARLEHPGIIPVYEAGRWSSGRAFYAMKFVSGRPLRDLIAQADSLEERLALVPNVIAVVEAVAYAHSERIVHRDLKPSNVIVGNFGETIVVDWGLAKDLNEPAEDELEATPYRHQATERLTVAGDVLGTPAYMPPEQARGELVDERSDIYALGAILYQVVTGRPPLRDSSTERLLALAREGRVPPVRSLAPKASDELVAVVTKAMARDPSERYQTAAALADDLTRLQNGRLVAAHHYGRRDLAWRWLRSHKTVVRVAAVAVAIVALISALSLFRIVAAEARAREQRTQLILTHAQTLLATDPTAALAWLKRYPLHAPRWDLAASIAAEARHLGVAMHVVQVAAPVRTLEFSPDGADLALSSPGRIERISLHAGSPLPTLWKETNSAAAFAWSPDSSLFAYDAGGSLIEVINRSGQRLMLLPYGRYVNELAFSPDSQLLIATGLDGVRVWRLSDRNTWLLKGGGPQSSGTRVAMSADGSVLAAWMSGPVYVWRLADVNIEHLDRVEPLLLQVDAEAYDVTVARDGSFLIAAYADGAVREWDVASGKQRTIAQDLESSVSVAMCESETLVAATSWNGFAALYDRATGAEVFRLRTDSPAVQVALSKNGRMVAAAARDGSIRVGYVDSRQSWTLRGHKGLVQHIRLSPDERELASSSADGGVRVWRLPQENKVVFPGPSAMQPPGGRIAFSPPGTHIATSFHGRNGNGVQWWDLQTTLRGADGRHGNFVERIAWSDDGQTLFVSSRGDASRVHLDEAVVEPLPMPNAGGVSGGIGLSRNGHWLAIPRRSGVTIANTATAMHHYLELARGEVLVACVSDDGTLVAAAYADGSIVTRDDVHGKQILPLELSTPVATMSLSRDGRWLLLVDRAQNGRLIEVSSGRTIARFSRVAAAELSGSGELVAYATNNHELRVFDHTTKRTLRFPGHDKRINQIVFANDESKVATASDDGTLRVWDTVTGSRTVLAGNEGPLIALSFCAACANADTVASMSVDGQVRVWRIAPGDWIPARTLALKGWLANETTASVDSGAETDDRVGVISSLQ